ncbi:MAG: sulfite exporter TauE/SafE family protein [Actinomycetota bacterium]|nr:sulfite exporter TauE/SafE family protein [Actinomycetota bacterium]
MDLVDVIVVVGAGLIAGVVNAMAGGGSLLTVAMLTVFAGLPGLVANGTNRVGILVQNAASVAGYRQEGVSGVRRAVPVLVPALLGSLLGSLVVSSLTDDAFERVFGILMVPLLVLSLKPPKSTGSEIAWSPLVTSVVFFAIGLYGGAFQAGVGLIIVVALARSGLDLVNANAVKVVVILALTAVATPVFILRGQVDWGFAALLAVGFAIGGWLGARVAVRGGERVIRPVLVIAVVALDGRMIGLY